MIADLRLILINLEEAAIPSLLDSYLGFEIASFSIILTV
jgi:hypothetical protein